MYNTQPIIGQYPEQHSGQFYRQQEPSLQYSGRIALPQQNFSQTQQNNNQFQQQQQSQQFVSPYTQSYYNNLQGSNGGGSNNTTSNMLHNRTLSQQAQQLGGSSFTGGLDESTSLTKILEKQALTSRINISEMYINDEGANRLTDILLKYKNINFVELKGNNISSTGFVGVFEALKSNFQLKVLGLQWNRLGGSDVAGLENLYALLANNRSITHIDLRNNRINETGAHIIANIIRTNNTLNSLDLRWNEIGNSAARAILASLQENYSIVSLELAGNSISENILQQVQQITTHNREGNQRNVRRVQIPQDQQLGNSHNNSLNDRDLDYRSRIQQQQQLGGGDQSQHIGGSVYNTSSYFERQNKQQQQQFQPLSSQYKNLPYEQEKILQHLEALIEDERISSLQIKETLTKQIAEKKASLEHSNTRKTEQQQQLGSIENTNNQLKNDLRDIELDLKDFEVKKAKDLQEVIQRNNKIENTVREQDKLQQEQIMALQDKNVLTIKTSEQENEEKVDNLRQKYTVLKSSLDDCRMAIHRVQDEMLQNDLNVKEKAKDVIDKLKDDARRSYQTKFDYLQAKLQRMQEGKLNAERIMSSYVSERVQKQRDFGNQLKDIEIQIAKRLIDIEDIGLRNKDFEIQKKKLENDIKNKGEIELLLENERDSVRHQFEENEKEVRRIQDEMDQDHKKEMNRVEGLLDIQRKRIHELESTLKDSNQQNHQLRQDYNRLQELLSGNLSKVIYNAFKDKNVV